MSMRKRIEGLSADQIRNLNIEEMDQPVTMSDFLEAISRVNSSVNNREDIKKYDQWMADYGSV